MLYKKIMPIVEYFREETVRLAHLDLQDLQDMDLQDLLDLQDLRDLLDLQELRARMEKLVQPDLLESLAGTASPAYLAPMVHQEKKALAVKRVIWAVPVTVAFLAIKGPKESMAFLGPTEIKAFAD